MQKCREMVKRSLFHFPVNKRARKIHDSTFNSTYQLYPGGMLFGGLGLETGGTEVGGTEIDGVGFGGTEFGAFPPNQGGVLEFLG
ncbi:hypothetical protein QUA56_14385 [Microcoleus sp. N3A4]